MQNHIPLSSFYICVLLAECWIRHRDGKDLWKCFPACCLLPVVVDSSVQKFLHGAACTITTFVFVFVFARLERILIFAVCYVVDNFILKSASCFSWNEWKTLSVVKMFPINVCLWFSVYCWREKKTQLYFWIYFFFNLTGRVLCSWSYEEKKKDLKDAAFLTFL